MTGGMMPGTLNVIAARPRVGKTAFALFMALNAARNGHPVCLYSLEMSKEQLVFRLLGCIADIEPSKILKGTLSAPEMKRIQRASDELERLPIWIDERTDLSVADLRYQISLRRKQGRCEMVIVDYLQLMLSLPRPQEHERPDIGHHTATKADRQGERHPRRAAEPAEPELRGETHAEEHAVRPA